MSLPFAAWTQALNELNPAAGTIHRACGLPGPVATSPCTVPAGGIEIDTNIVDATITRADDTKATTYLLFSSLLKVGLGHRADFEIAVTPWQQTAVDATSDRVRNSSGTMGDLQFGTKLQFLEKRSTSVAFLPSIKIPAGTRGLGTLSPEPSLSIPVAIDLPRTWKISFMPEITSLKSQTNSERETALTSLFGIGRNVNKEMILSMNLSSQLDLAARQTSQQWSMNIGTDWTPERHHNLHLDVGMSLGLRRGLGLEAYAGFAWRFSFRR
jgi:ribosomal protein S13